MWLSLLQASGDFPSGHIYRHGAQYVYQASAPEQCPVCQSTACRYHAHGSFTRWFKTYIGKVIQKSRLRKPRWKCLTCGHTFSLHPPEGMENKSICNFILVLLLWHYLSTAAGLHRCIPGQMAEVISERTLARYLKAAKKVATKTQQFIREVLIEKTEPRPVEDLFPGGLDPPESLLRKQRNDLARASTLWRGLCMLYQGAKALRLDPRALLAWARKRSRKLKQDFLM